MSNSMMQRQPRLQIFTAVRLTFGSIHHKFHHEFVGINSVPPHSSGHPGSVLASTCCQIHKATSAFDWRPWHQTASASGLSPALEGCRSQDTPRRGCCVRRNPDLLNGISTATMTSTICQTLTPCSTGDGRCRAHGTADDCRERQPQ